MQFMPNLNKSYYIRLMQECCVMYRNIFHLQTTQLGFTLIFSAYLMMHLKKKLCMKYQKKLLSDVKKTFQKGFFVVSNRNIRSKSTRKLLEIASNRFTPNKFQNDINDKLTSETLVFNSSFDHEYRPTLLMTSSLEGPRKFSKIHFSRTANNDSDLKCSFSLF